MTIGSDMLVSASVPAAADIVAACALIGAQLAVEFADGRKGSFDTQPFLRYPAFAQLANHAYFQRVFVAHGTICWPDGEDFSPETVAARLVTA